KPMEPLRVRIIRITEEAVPTWTDDLALPPGEIGEIVVQGPNVTQRYHNSPEATGLAKIADPGAKSFFHRMGDLGYFDGDGRLWYCGRKSQRVITAQGTLYTVCCEGVFNAHPHVARTALVGVGASGSAIPVLCVELNRGAAETKTITRELLALGAQ